VANSNAGGVLTSINIIIIYPTGDNEEHNDSEYGNNATNQGGDREANAVGGTGDGLWQIAMQAAF